MLVILADPIFNRLALSSSHECNIKISSGSKTMVVATQIYVLVLGTMLVLVFPLNKLHGKIPDKVFG